MQQSFLATVGLPAAVFVVMMAVGLALQPAEFRTLLADRRAVSVGLVSQLMVLPLIGFSFAWLLNDEPLVAASVVLLAGSPGGATSNVIVHLTDGDRALSVSLTAASSMVSWITLPAYLGVALAVFGGDARTIEVPLADIVVQVALLTVVPVGLGMIVRSWRPGFAERSRRLGRILSSLVLTAIVLALVVENIDLIVEDGPRWAPALLLFNVTALLVGYGLARLRRLGRRQAATVGIETGIQNAALAIAVALVSLDSVEMSVIPALYGLMMLITGYSFAHLALRRRRSDAVATA